MLARFTRETRQNADCAAFLGPFLDLPLRRCDWVATTLIDPESVAEPQRRRIDGLAAVAALFLSETAPPQTQ